MPIVKRQPGEAKAAATAGKVIGEAEKAKRQQAIALEREQRSSQLAAQKRAMDWEAEKMAMRSQQDFQQELADKQWEFEKFNRAKQWDIEKMEMRSRLDFEQEEKGRQKRIDSEDAKILALDRAEETGTHSKEALAPYRAQAEMNKEIAKAGGTRTAPLIRPDKPVRPPSATRQVGEMEALFELQGYTQQDVIEAGGDPAGFPGIGGEGFEQPLSEYTSPTSQAEYDAIPSGTDYIDSKGNIRTKR